MSEITANKQAVGFIGSGNMAQAIIEGMLSSGFPASQLHVCSPQASQKYWLKNIEIAQADNDLESLLACCDIIIYAAKPQQMSAIAHQCACFTWQAPSFVSVAAGVTVEVLKSSFPHAQHFIRVMPNTPSLVKAGVAGIYYADNQTVDLTDPHSHRELIRLIFESVGDVVKINKESDMDIVTAIAGSGPAYFYLLAEHMIAGAINLGLPDNIARKLVEKTLYGSGQLLDSQVETVETLRKKVTSPGGTTAAATNYLNDNGLEALVSGAVEQATLRGKELSKAVK